MLPGGTSAAPTPLQGPVNRFRDVAEDIQYQYIGELNLVTFTATRIHENLDLTASFAAAAAANPTDNLTTTRATATYYYRRRIGASLGYFSTTGSADAGLYPQPQTGGTGVITSASTSPDTRGWIAEVNYLPWLNTKLSAQYTRYSRFNGGSGNYDGLGRAAADNNALYLLLWFAY